MSKILLQVFFFFFFKQWGVHTQLSILFDSKARHSITLCCNIVWAKSIKAFFQDYTFSSDSYVPIPTVSRESRIIERQREFHLITNTCLMSNSRLCYLPIYHMFHFHMRSRILLSSTIFSHVWRIWDMWFLHRHVLVLRWGSRRFSIIHNPMSNM